MGNIIIKYKKIISHKYKKIISHKFNSNLCNTNNNDINLMMDDIMIDDYNMDYCYNCDEVIIYNVIEHCTKCNKCHNIYKQSYCNICNCCVDPHNNFDIIRHKKKCTLFM